MRKKFEYKRVYDVCTTVLDMLVAPVLERYGRDGWELCTIDESGAWLKREIIEGGKTE